MKKYIIILLLIAFSLMGYAENFAPVGTSTGQFLTVGVGGREVAMGEAVAAITSGSGSVFWNPAGLVDGNSNDIYAAYNQWPAGIHVGGLSYAYNNPKIGVFSINTKYVNFGDMEITTEQAPDGTGEMLQMSNYCIGLSYGRYLTDKVSIGLTAKLVNERYGTNGYTTVAWDVGLIYRANFRNLKIGMSIMNFSNKVQFNGSYIDYSYARSYLTGIEVPFDSWSLPMTFRFGAVIDVINRGASKLIAAVDMVHPNDNVEQYNIGVEYAYDNMVFVRAGYQLSAYEGGLSGGIGFKWNMINIDYAISALGNLGLTNRLSLGFNI
ncbi:MAG: PorV/PorQ family protein [Candidatus Marinimicrobia bacterium]|nr:PorV/PorQ family protein [Candidatus Neomarinimicrobiota bacterium]